MTLVSEPARGGYDLIVIGAGPAGLTVARKLEALTDLRVLIVESGVEDVGIASKLAIVQAEGDLPAHYFARHSQRVFGGTSRVWGGWCAVLDERPFLADEWPFPYRELYGYYPEAARILNVPPVVHERPEVPLDDTEGNVVYRPWYFSPVRFVWHGDLLGAKCGPGYWVRNSATVDVLLGHTALRLATRDGAIEGVSLARSHADAKSFHVAAERVVLAAGSIQNARLLLLSLGKERSPALGRYLVEHPHLYEYCRLEIDQRAAERVMDRSRRRQANLYFATKPANDAATPEEAVAHGIGLSSSFSNEHALGSATMELATLHPAEALLAGRRRPVLATATLVRAEMTPIESNSVALSSTGVDFLGQPRARVAMRFDLAAVKRAVALLNAELVRAGIGRFQWHDHEPSFVRGTGPYVTGEGHLMGTTRMGKDPSRSVTDAAGRVHGFSNLYVAGSSLFPASSAANPTLTIVALALRLAEHLAGRAQ